MEYEVIHGCTEGLHRIVDEAIAMGFVSMERDAASQIEALGLKCEPCLLSRSPTRTRH